eukprot:TRINITY_DN11085_c0_g1_i1.p1 TRINITY_DN11085_c0_g1~~TRINITY_DN11085_c0_g1_i1.p1  ORF type:complete len:574 (+),score=73.79 TRINITY_DN11085_c0_g1_i1:95-1816(+)
MQPDYVVRQLLPADEAIIARWRSDAEIGVPGYRMLAKGGRKEYRTRLSSYEKWKSVVVEKHTPNGKSVPVSCCGWGVKEVMCKKEKMTMVYVMDGAANPADKESLAVGLHSRAVSTWKEQFDGEYASCCSTGNVGTIDMQTLLNNGFSALGSCRVYGWPDDVHKQWSSKIRPPRSNANISVESIQLARVNTDILNFWERAFGKLSLLPVHLRELIEHPSYVGSILTKAEGPAWGCASRWCRNAEAPMLLDNGIQLKYELICCIGGSGDVNMSLEAIRVAGENAIAEGAEIIFAVIDEGGDPQIRLALENLTPSCMRYVNGAKLYDSNLLPNSTTPTFWDPRDMGIIYTLVRNDTSLLPSRLKSNAALIPRDVMEFVSGIETASLEGCSSSTQEGAADEAQSEEKKEKLKHRKDRKVVNAPTPEIATCHIIITYYTIGFFAGCAYLFSAAERGTIGSSTPLELCNNTVGFLSLLSVLCIPFNPLAVEIPASCLACSFSFGFSDLNFFDLSPYRVTLYGVTILILLTVFIRKEDPVSFARVVLVGTGFLLFCRACAFMVLRWVSDLMLPTFQCGS